METEIQSLETPLCLSLSSRHGSTASSSSAWGAEDNDLKYTSLKDILLVSPPPPSLASHHDGLVDFESLDIPIRNQLVKHAASAYLHSAIILPARNQSCLSRFWGHVRDRAAALGSAWRGCTRDPVEFVFGSVRRILACPACKKARNGLQHAWFHATPT